MNEIQRLIQEMCPDGVPMVALGNLGKFENIGVDKKTVEGEPLVTLLNYVDVYHHKKIDSSIPNMIVSSPIKKVDACSVLKGDIFVTPSSETVDDIGHSAVIMEDLANTVYSYHIMRYRMDTFNMTTSFYINYMFDTFSVTKQILTKAQGLTRFGLSKDKFAKIQIPLPPLPIQQRIVETLDKFTSLVSSLDSEIALRQKQYEYYRNKFLTFEEGVSMVFLGDVISNLRTGLNPRVHFKLNTPDAQGYYITVRELKGFTIEPDEKTDRINEQARLRINERSKLKQDDILFSGTGTIGRTALLIEEPTNWNIKEGVYAITPLKEKISPRFLLYVLHSDSVKEQIEGKAAGAAVRSVPMAEFKSFRIPLPSLETQRSIVRTLDTFESLLTNLKKERALRQKQYEYYREKLLTFA